MFPPVSRGPRPQYQVMTVVLAPAVDLKREEEEGGLGGPIDLGSPLLYRTPSPQELDKVTVGAIEALGRNWEFLAAREETTSGDYTLRFPPWAEDGVIFVRRIQAFTAHTSDKVLEVGNMLIGHSG